MNIIKHLVNCLISKMNKPMCDKRMKNKIIIKIRNINIYFFDD